MLDKLKTLWYNKRVAGMAQSVEHVIGNDEVISSILITSSTKTPEKPWFLGLFVFKVLYYTVSSIAKQFLNHVLKFLSTVCVSSIISFIRL